ncbi:hypothetical protein [Burkholderia sp. Bp8992]|uniref:hypothetical protein n=1 Tax=Burkholderia sp. Bp8992 TaxID=2184554 RepID=UPI0039089DB7
MFWLDMSVPRFREKSRQDRAESSAAVILRVRISCTILRRCSDGEARRLMLAEGPGAAEAGFRVGYESPSRSGREYARLFDTPPKRDTATRKALASG